MSTAMRATWHILQHRCSETEESNGGELLEGLGGWIFQPTSDAAAIHYTVVHCNAQCRVTSTVFGLSSTSRVSDRWRYLGNEGILCCHFYLVHAPPGSACWPLFLRAPESWPLLRQIYRNLCFVLHRNQKYWKQIEVCFDAGILHPPHPTPTHHTPIFTHCIFVWPSQLPRKISQYKNTVLMIIFLSTDFTLLFPGILILAVLLSHGSKLDN
jgi:hypothetical protein